MAMTTAEQEIATRLAQKMAKDYATGDFARTQIFYMRDVALDLINEREATKAEATHEN